MLCPFVDSSFSFSPSSPPPNCSPCYLSPPSRTRLFAVAFLLCFLGGGGGVCRAGGGRAWGGANLRAGGGKQKGRGGKGGGVVSSFALRRSSKPQILAKEFVSDCPLNLSALIFTRRLNHIFMECEASRLAGVNFMLIPGPGRTPKQERGNVTSGVKNCWK